MWKIAVGFALFAALAIFMLMQGGDINLGGETHGMDAPHEATAAASAPMPAASQ